MSALDDRELTRAIRDAAHPLRGAPSDFDPLLALIGDARVVLLGEATHGTHEFYELRARITKRLLVERGFGAVVIEGDWPDAYRVNRYVRDCSADSEAIESLAGFRRFPQWMWRNADVLDFVGWLRRHNDRKGERQRAGFYGLDLYSLHASIAAVLRWLAVVDPGAAARARERYACFELFGPDPRDYGRLTSLGIAPPCEQEVVSQLVELRQETGRLLAHADTRAGDDLFFAQQNARVVLNAERYYRAMFGDYVRSWNLRDQHMTETLAALLAHLCTNMARSRVVVWAHNAHIGDARATEMGTRGEVTLGQLAREQLGANVVSVGFTTYTGSVTAARDWEEPAEHVAVRPALRESYEWVLHAAGAGDFVLPLRGPGAAARGLRAPRLERAIGVVYRPGTERQSHYLTARLADQFDAVVHVDESRAVEPVERTGLPSVDELPATYPMAL